MQTTDTKTMTNAPGTTDFMPPECLADRPAYGVSLDVFSYGGVILYTITQLWLQPSSWVQFDPDTGGSIYLSELQRRQRYLDKMIGGTANLKPLVISCLDNNPKSHPPLTQVSMTIKRAKDECSQKSSRDGMSPIIWWAEVTSGQQSQVSSSLTAALEEMTINNDQLRREVDVLTTDNTQLRTNNDAMKDENEQLKAKNDVMKDEMVQLKANNDAMKDDIDKQRDQNRQLQTEVDTTKAENIQLKTEIDGMRRYTGTRKLQPLPRARQQSKQQLLLKESNMPGDLFSGPVNIKWEEGAPVSVGRRGHTAVWLNGLVYVGGGYETGDKESCVINCYDPVSKSWSSSINTPYCNFAMATLNNKIVTAGGEDRIGKTMKQILTMNAGQLKNYTKMITARSWATAAGHQGMLILTGGKDDKGKILSSTELFDSNNGQWYKCSDLPQPHWCLKSVIHDNMLYLLGGVNKDVYSSPVVFIAPLDTMSMHQLKWNTHQDTPRCLSAPVSVNGTHLLIVGGLKHTSDVYKLNNVSNSWEVIGRIPSARCDSAAVSTADNRVIVIGGENDKREYTNTLWIGSYEPQ